MFLASPSSPWRPLGRLKLGVRGICSPAIHKDFKEKSSIPRCLRRGFFIKWLNEQKYKELISVAHQGWFNEDDFLLPLAEYFIKEKELNWLKFLCEKTI
ncbi:MAG: hypothetical protein LBH51_04265, partial [Treponema sp.]|nr:hypothetical protein [Treponema sp.]